jgi:hypothetical protein
VIRARFEGAPVVAQGFHLDGDGQPTSHVRGGRAHDHPGPVPPGRLADSARHLRRNLRVGRHRPWCEARPGRRPRLDPVDAEGTPGAPVGVPGHQVPALPVVHQAVRLHRAPAGRPGVRLVVEPEPLMVPARTRDHRQHVRIHPRAARRNRQRVGLEGADPVTQPGGEDLLQLGQGTYRGLLDPRDRAARGGTQPDRDGHGLLVVEQQWRQGAAGAEPVSAGHARPRVDRIAQPPQPVHVMADGAGGDAEPGGQLGTGPVAPGLQQRQQAQQPCRSFRHSPILTAI